MRKKLKFEIEPMRHKWPVFAIGFMAGGKEFLVVLWLIDFRISWGY
jgi:hypothetical protein